MGLFGRHHDPPVARISISDPDPVSEIRALRPVVERLVEVVQTLSVRVGGLRLDLAVLRGEPVPASDDLHIEAGPQAPSQDAVVEAEQLRRTFDALHDRADALWFESQWLTAEIAVATGEFAVDPDHLVQEEQ